MDFVYHGSKEHGLKRLEPRKSTHGTYVYATKEKVLALNFSGRCGDDLTYDIGHFDNEKNDSWQLVENIPGGFDKMFSNSSSIYTLSSDTFKNINTGFEEVVSEDGVDIIDEEYYENVYDGLLKAEKEGLVKLYRYPNKPNGMSEDCFHILDKWRYYKYKLNKDFKKYEFERLFYLHPDLMVKINDLAKEFGYDYNFEPNNLVNIFKERIDRQLHYMEHEEYIDCAYISICKIYPNLKVEIDNLYNDYLTTIYDKKR